MKNKAALILVLMAIMSDSMSIRLDAQLLLPEPTGVFIKESFKQSSFAETIEGHQLQRFLYEGPVAFMTDPHPRLIWKENPGGQAVLEWTYYFDERGRVRVFMSRQPVQEWSEAAWAEWQKQLITKLPQKSIIKPLRSPLEERPIPDPILGWIPVRYAVSIEIPEQPFAWVLEDFWIQDPRGQGSWLVQMECPEPLYAVFRQGVVRFTSGWAIVE